MGGRGHALVRKAITFIDSPMAMGVVAQASSSGVSFLLNLVLVATMSPDRFGEYSAAITVVYFLSGLGAALWTTQVTVFDTASDADGRRAHFKNHMPPFKWMVGLALLALLWLGWGHAQAGGSPVFSASVVLSIVLCAYGFFLKEYLVRFTYNSNSLKNTAVAQVIFATAALSCFFLVKFLRKDQVFEGVFISLAAGNCAAFLFIYARFGFFKVQPGPGLGWDKYFRPGLHGTFSHVLSCLRNYGYVYISPIFIGMRGLAEINAARITTSITSITTPPLTQIHQARMIRKESATDIRRGRRQILLVTLLSSLPIAAAYPYLSKTVLSKYDDLFLLVVLWCVQAMVAAYRSTLEVEILAQHLFRIISITNAIALVCTVVLVVALSHAFGAVGALLALIAAEVIATIAFKWLQKYY